MPRTMWRLFVLLIALSGGLVAQEAAPQAGDELWVAVGYGGRRMVSIDGLRWEITAEWSQPGGDDSDNLMSAVFDRGKFVAVGGGGGGPAAAGHILVSADGREWREVRRDSSRVNPVVAGNGRLIAGRSRYPSGSLLWSTDGETWREGAAIATKGLTHFRGGAYGDGRFVLVGNAGGQGGRSWAVVTRDGETIDGERDDLPGHGTIVYGAGRFLMLTSHREAKLIGSRDGLAWSATPVAEGVGLSWLVWTGREFLAGDGRRQYRSADGEQWSVEETRSRGSVVWSDGRRAIGTSWPGKMSFTADGSTWQDSPPLSANGINRVIHRPAAGAPPAAALEQRWRELATHFTPPAEFAEQYGDYRSPLRFADGTPVRTAEEWSRRRAELLAEWRELLGAWPPPVEDLGWTVLESVDEGAYMRHKIRFRWTPAESTTGYLLVPPGEGPRPAVITVYYEPETAIGEGKPDRDFARQLALRGFVTLSIGTTEATEAKTYSLYYPSLDDARVQPLAMLAYAASSARRALARLPEVDPRRIGIVGHSFGGKWAMFASCLDEEFAAAAWSDPGIVFDESRPSVNYWEPWYLGYHPRPWRERGVITEANPARGLYPQLVAAGRDLHELHALMAPRPFLVSGGAEDPPARWLALYHSVAVQRLLGHEGRVGMTNRPDHAPNPDSNEQILTFFEWFLLRDQGSGVRSEE